MPIDEAAPLRHGRVAVLLVCVLVMMLALAWVYRGMRTLMSIGGACGSGGPYVYVQPCPGSATALLTLGIFLMVAAALVGSAVAVSVRAPVLLLSMWWLLFGSLGWNFVDHGLMQRNPVDDSIVWGWAICGVVFWLMALPALLIQVALLLRLSRRLPEGAGRVVTRIENDPGWWVGYLLFGAVGVGLGWWTFDQWAT